MNYRNKLGVLTIRGRLFLGFSVLVIPIIFMTVIFLFKIDNMKLYTQHWINVIMPTKSATAQMDAQIFETQQLLFEWIATKDERIKNQLSKIWGAIKNRQTEMGVLETQWINKEFINKWTKLKNLYIPLESTQNKIMSLPSTIPKEKFNLLIIEEKRLASEMINLINSTNPELGEKGQGLYEIENILSLQGAQNLLSDMNNLRHICINLILIILVLASIVSWITAKKIIEPIKACSLHSGKVAAGDLTQRILVLGEDEVGKLAKDMNAMTESLANITKNITSSSQEMVSILDQVKRASDVQSTGVSEQASSINQITASLEEIDKSTTQTRGKAKKMGEIAEKTSQQGERGLSSVKQSIEGMKLIKNKVETIAQTILELSNQTQQVGEITAVVNTIALQSKMLALNASIEAAKAGEAGKGFSVVAVEVRNLAEQSEQSTIQVQKILEDIKHGTEKAVLVTEEGTKGVDQGMKLVEQMGDVVQNLTGAIDETMAASQQIEAAVRQESLGIEQITAGMNEISQVISSFVQTVKQTNESLSKLANTATSIKNYVEIYKV